GVTPPGPPSGWEVRYLSEVPLTAHVPDEHPLAGQAAVDISQLAKYPLILMTETHSARRVFDHAAATTHIRLENYKESQSSIMAQAAAASGRGIAILTDEPQFGLDSVRITHGRKEVSFPIYAGWKQHHYATKQIRAWADDLALWISENPSLSR